MGTGLSFCIVPSAYIGLTPRDSGFRHKLYATQPELVKSSRPVIKNTPFRLT